MGEEKVQKWVREFKAGQENVHNGQIHKGFWNQTEKKLNGTT